MLPAKKKLCLILGGGGFIGKAVASAVLADGWAVRVFDRLGAESPLKLEGATGIDWVPSDFQNSAELAHALDGADAVVHLISTTLPKASNEAPAHDVETNVIATLRLLALMVERHIRKIVFASSGGTVYGIPRVIPIPEDHPTCPEVSYGIAKLMIEKYLYLYGRLYGLQPIILRIANPYGAGQRADRAQGAVAAFLYHALRDEPLDIWGDGSVTRDYLHVCDVARAFVCALHYEGTHQIFNIGAGSGLSLNELVTSIELHLGHRLSRRYLPGRSFDVPINVLDNTLARTELHWTPSIKFPEGLRMTIADLMPPSKPA